MPDKISELTILDKQVAFCTKCSLCNSRTRVVFGAGNIHCYVMIVGEAPGDEEDASGLPFVGRSGQKLMEILAALGYPREHFFITNAVKCRPQTNNKPTPFEVEMCNPYLRKQVELIEPKVILALGGTALHAVMQQPFKIMSVRGTWMQTKTGTLVMPTYHPSHVMRNNTAEVNAMWLDDISRAFKRGYSM